MAKDYYKILGIEKTASADEIKQAFRKKAHQFHPDKANGDADKFKEINEAYQVLGNAEKRKQYDQFGSTFDNAGGFGGGMNWSDFARQSGFGASGFQNSSFDFGDLGDIFGDIFGGRSSGGRRRTKTGHDLEALISLTLEEAVFGTEKMINVSKKVVCEHCHGNGAEPGTKINTCSTCKGSGQVAQNQSTFFGNFRSIGVCPECHGEGKKPEKQCSKCHGQGVVSGKEKVKVSIPAGIDDKQTIKLSGRGEAGVLGAPAGDLYINVKVLPHKVFGRTGDNLTVIKKINYSQATLGDKIKLETLDNKTVSIKIPSGTPSGKKLIVRGHGASKLQSRGRGDLIVEIKVVIPDKLTKEQKKLMEKLAEQGL